MEKKLFELKKSYSAKMCEQMGLMGPSRAQKLRSDVLEEDDLNEMDFSNEKPDYKNLEDRRGQKIDAKVGDWWHPALWSKKGDKLTQQQLDDINSGKMKGGSPFPDSFKKKEPIIIRIDEQAAGGSGLIVPKVDRSQKTDLEPQAGKGDLGSSANPINQQSVDDAEVDDLIKRNTKKLMDMKSRGMLPPGHEITTKLEEDNEEQLDEVNVPTVNYQGSSGSSSVYTRSTKNPFNRGTEVLADKMKQNIGGNTQTFKQKTTINNLGNNSQSVKSSSSTSTMNEETEKQLDEARVKIVKARIRGGKIQRRKKVSNVEGYKVQGGQLKRMSPVEKRNRKLGQRRGKIKRRSKMTRTLMKRQKSLRKRQSLGI